MTTPYTYLIGWSAINKYYYGRRTAKGCSPSDLWITYFTSSQHVKLLRSIHGEPDIISIRKTFNDVTSCAKWESTVLRRMQAARSTRFINKTNGDTNFDATGVVYATLIDSGVCTMVSTDEYHNNRHLYRHHSQGAVHVVDINTGNSITITTDEYHKNKHLYKHRSTGVMIPAATRDRMSRSHKGIPKSETHKRNIAKALTGRKQSPEHLANATKNRNPAKKAVVINGVTYESVSLASKLLGVSVGMLCNRLAGRLAPNAQWWEVRYVTDTR